MIKVSWMRKKFWSIYYDCTVAATTLFITHKTQKQYSAILKNYCTLSARGSLLKKIFFIFTLVVSASIVWRSVIFSPLLFIGWFHQFQLTARMNASLLALVVQWGWRKLHLKRKICLKFVKMVPGNVAFIPISFHNTLSCPCVMYSTWN